MAEEAQVMEKGSALTQFSPKDNWVLLQRQCKAFLDSGFLLMCKQGTY